MTTKAQATRQLVFRNGFFWPLSHLASSSMKNQKTYSSMNPTDRKKNAKASHKKDFIEVKTKNVQTFHFSTKIYENIQMFSTGRS